MDGVEFVSSPEGHPATVARPRDPVRLAGMLLLISFCVDLLRYGIELQWDWRPTPAGLVDTALQAVLGIGLIYYGRRFSFPTLVFMLVVALIPCVRSVLTFSDVGIGPILIIVSVPLIAGLVRALPFILLLVPKRARIYYAVAIGLYVLYQVVHLTSVALTIYAGNWLRAPSATP